MYNFNDKVIIITGAAGALGSHVAKAFNAAGAKLSLVDRAEDRLAEIFSELTDPEQTCFGSATDLTDEDSVAAMVGKTLDRFGQIDGLINIAGGYRAGDPLPETPLGTWDFLMNLNAKTVFLAMRAVLPPMLARGYGKIVSVSAKPGLEGGAKAGPYSVSKSAVLRLTEAAAAEVAGHGININAIVPRIIDTPGNRQAMPNADYSKWVTPAQLANVFMFLCADESAAIHGAAIPVYGSG